MTSQDTNTVQQTQRRTVLFTLWIVVMFLYTYGDILSLMDHQMLAQIMTGVVDGIVLSEGLLLGAAVLMAMPIFMILISQLAPYQIARWANIFVGLLKSVVVVTTLFSGFTSYYLLMSCLEVPTTLAIVWLAWTWRPEQA